MWVTLSLSAVGTPPVNWFWWMYSRCRLAMSLRSGTTPLRSLSYRRSHTQVGQAIQLGRYRTRQVVAVQIQPRHLGQAAQLGRYRPVQLHLSPGGGIVSRVLRAHAMEVQPFHAPRLRTVFSRRTTPPWVCPSTSPTSWSRRLPSERLSMPGGLTVGHRSDVRPVGRRRSDVFALFHVTDVYRHRDAVRQWGPSASSSVAVTVTV